MPSTVPATSQPQKSDAPASDNISSADAKRQLLSSFLERQKPDEPAAPAETTPPATPAEVVTPDSSTELPATSPENPAPDPAPEPAPETPATEPETPETEPEHSPDVLSQLSSLDPATRDLVEKILADRKKHTQEQIQKRIDKERAKSGNLERELEAAKRSAAQPEIIRVGTPTESDPYADVADAAALNKREAEAREIYDWAQSHFDNDDWESVQGPDGKPVPAARWGDAYYSKAQVRQALRNSERAVKVLIPAKHEQFKRRQAVNQAISIEFPSLRDRNSPDFLEAEKYRQAYPQLAAHPDSDLIIAYAMEGLKTVEARRKAREAAAATKPKTTATPPPSSQTAVPATAAAAPRLSSDRQAAKIMQAEKEKLGKQGNMTSDDARRYFLKQESLKR